MTADNSRVAAVQAACGEIESIAASARSRRRPPGQDASGAAVSYALNLAGNSPQGFASLVAAVESLLAQLEPTATVRTASDEEAIETLVRYTAGASSISTSNLSPYMTQIHRVSVERTYALRSAVARAFVAAASTMVVLSASVANPLLLLHALSTARSLEQALRRLASAVEAAI